MSMAARKYAPLIPVVLISSVLVVAIPVSVMVWFGMDYSNDAFTSPSTPNITGVILLGVGIVCILYAFVRLIQTDWSEPRSRR